MAGAGFKTFNTGDVLTAADVNTYLMQQTVMVFADSAARTTALGANVSEGMLSYLKDTNQVEVYNGSSWVASDDPNAIQNTIVDAKGDLISATAADTPARLAVGTDGQVLTADSTTATGLKWAAAAASGGMTLISTATPSGATTISFTSIPTTYKQLYIIWDLYHSSSGEYLYIRLNNNSAGNYYYDGIDVNNSSLSIARGDGVTGFGDSATIVPVGPSSSSAQARRYKGFMTIERANEAVDHQVNWQAFGANSTGTNWGGLANGIFTVAAAITRLDFIRSSTQTITGTVLLYGVS